MWMPKLDGRNGPVYRAIADAIDEDVQNGALRAGARLPPHRDLADHLGVTVTTITRAYTEAARRGLTSGHVGRGTFIRGAEAEDDAGLLDMSVNILMPDQEVLNLQPHLFQRRVLPWTQLFGYAPKRGHVRHRQILAGWLAEQGLVCHPDHILPTAGAQHGLAVAFQTLLEPGDTLLMEEVTYAGARLLAEQRHVKPRPVSMDVEGLRPDALDAACRTTRARVLYCLPRLHNPTSAVMSEKRRRQIAAIAGKYRLTVIEDDVYGFTSAERTPLAALLPERTVFVTSLSKSLLPGLRAGCIVASPPLIERLVIAVWATMVMVSPVGLDLACSWIEDGTAARIAEWKRREFVARQVMARRLLQRERVQTQPTSPHLWLHLPARWTPETFVASVRARGVVVNASTEFAVADPAPRCVRLCLGTPKTRASLEQALGHVVDVLGERVPAARVVV